MTRRIAELSCHHGRITLLIKTDTDPTRVEGIIDLDVEATLHLIRTGQSALADMREGAGWTATSH